MAFGVDSSKTFSERGGGAEIPNAPGHTHLSRPGVNLNKGIQWMEKKDEMGRRGFTRAGKKEG